MRIYTFHGPNNSLATARTKEGAYEKWVETMKAIPNGSGMSVLRAPTQEIYSMIEVDDDPAAK